MYLHKYIVKSITSAIDISSLISSKWHVTSWREESNFKPKDIVLHNNEKDSFN